MNELLQAAKAVIDATSTGDRWCAIANLKSAVERAEKQETVGFAEWWGRNKKYCETPFLVYNCWTAAQQAERERCREIVITMGGPDVPELLRQIDSGEE